MRIAVTGARGFVGRHVLAALRDLPVDVVATMRGREAPPPTGDRMTWTRMDLSSPGPAPLRQLGSPDILLHLAWDGLPNYQSAHHVDTELTVQTNFLGACLDAGLKRLVVSGTCFEYGLANGELGEDHPATPVSAYGIAKDRLRRWLEQRQREHDFDLAWLRLFYLFGPGQSDRSLYSQLQAAIARGDPSFDMSPGDQVRDFLPVDEAARLIVAAALSSGRPGIVNLCSGVPVSVRDRVMDWLAASGVDMTLNLGRLPYSELEPMAFWGSRRKLDALLGNP